MNRWAWCFIIFCLIGCASQNRPAQLVGGAGPIYPPQAKAEGVEGYVTVIYDISAEGQVINLVVVDSNPSGVFDDAALTAVASWRFNPRIIEGRAVAALRRQSTVTFKLSGSDTYDRY